MSILERAVDAFKSIVGLERNIQRDVDRAINSSEALVAKIDTLSKTRLGGIANFQTNRATLQQANIPPEVITGLADAAARQDTQRFEELLHGQIHAWVLEAGSILQMSQELQRIAPARIPPGAAGEEMREKVASMSALHEGLRTVHAAAMEAARAASSVVPQSAPPPVGGIQEVVRDALGYFQQLLGVARANMTNQDREMWMVELGRWDANTRQRAMSTYNLMTQVLGPDEALRISLVEGYLTHRVTSSVTALLREIKTSGEPVAKWLEIHDPTKTGGTIPEAVGLFVRALVNPAETESSVKGARVRMSVKKTTDAVAQARGRIVEQNTRRAADRAQRAAQVRRQEPEPPPGR